ncbi:MAG: 3-hydroxyacyl-CoA dehydrogenase family protein [Bacteroidia bacterium]
MEGIYCYGYEFQYEDWGKKVAECPALAAAQWLNIEDELPEDAIIVFDFLLDEAPDRLEDYEETEGLLVIGGGVNFSLFEMVELNFGKGSCQLAGIAAWPGMLSRAVWEVSFLDEASEAAFAGLFEKLAVETGVVADRVGMATPRLLSMIINEACFTVQEGTASREDINQAMKLGVNYPGGPFEWLEKFGPARVVNLLNAMFEDTHNGRYKVCPMLKREAILANV